MTSAVSIISAVAIGLGPRPTAFVGSNPAVYSQWLAGQAVATDEHDTGSSCPTAIVHSLGGSPAGAPFLKPPPPNEFVDTTVVEHLQLDGCGRSRRLNYLVFRTTAGRWMASRMLDGESRAGGRLQHDALQSAVMAFVVAAHCTSADEAQSTLHVVESKILPAQGGGGTWQELWTTTLCGNAVGAKVSFVPDAAGPGTSFSITPVQADGQPLKAKKPAP